MKKKSLLALMLGTAMVTSSFTFPVFASGPAEDEFDAAASEITAKTEESVSEENAGPESSSADSGMNALFAEENYSYVLMNIPYDKFYAAENTVDTISSATLNGKARNVNVNGASYHQSEAAAASEGIAGVTYPVYAPDSVLEALAAGGAQIITNDSLIEYTMKVRGQDTQMTLAGAKALQEAPSYSYYVLDEAPAAYKQLTAAEDGTVSFGAAVGTPAAGSVTGEVTYAGHHTDIEIVLDGVNADPADVSAIIVTTNKGSYAMHHVVNIWRGTDIGWNLSDLDIAGEKITNIRYYLKDGSITDYAADIDITEYGFVLMNIPYDRFYQAQGLSADVDAVTSATVKTYNQTMAGGSYHDGYDAADPISDAKILGVTCPVLIEDMNILSNYTQITDADSAVITVATGKSSLGTKEVSGKDLLFASGDYAYYILADKPSYYKTFTAASDGPAFSALASPRKETAIGSASVTYNGHYTDITVSVEANEITDAAAVNAVILTTTDGGSYALRHVSEIWRKTELGWDWDGIDGTGLSGKTIDSITYYVSTADGYASYKYPVGINIKRNPEADAISAYYDGSSEMKFIAAAALPSDIENALATLKTKVGRGETAETIIENAEVPANGVIALPTTLEEAKTYVLTITSDNYADISKDITADSYTVTINNTAGSDAGLKVTAYAPGQSPEVLESGAAVPAGKPLYITAENNLKQHVKLSVANGEDLLEKEILSGTADGYQDLPAAGNVTIELKETDTTRLTKSMVTLKTTAYVYNGSAKKPAVTVKAGDTVLKKGTDYTVNYLNNTKVGKAAVTVTGIGYYKGTVTKSFTINPKGTSLKSVTAGTAAFTAKWTKQAKEITGYQIQYSLKKSFASGNRTVKAAKASAVSRTVKNLKSGKTYYVRIRTYKTVNGKTYYSSWSAAKKVKTK